MKFARIKVSILTLSADTVIAACDELATGGAPKPSELSTVKIVAVVV